MTARGTRLSAGVWAAERSRLRKRLLRKNSLQLRKQHDGSKVRLPSATKRSGGARRCDERFVSRARRLPARKVSGVQQYTAPWRYVSGPSQSVAALPRAQPVAETAWLSDCASPGRSCLPRTRYVHRHALQHGRQGQIPVHAPWCSTPVPSVCQTAVMVQWSACQAYADPPPTEPLYRHGALTLAPLRLGLWGCERYTASVPVNRCSDV